MRIFVAGGSGVIGARLLPKLAAEGHEVTVITRDRAKLELLSEHANAVECDVYDVQRLTEVVDAARPEVVVNQLTDLPESYTPTAMKAAYEGNDRVRRVGTANLLRAATSAGAARVVSQSVAFWYAPVGDAGRLHVESDPLYLEASAPIGDAARAVSEVEAATLGSTVFDGVVLRYGFLYGPGTWFSRSGSVARDVVRHRYPIVGKGRGVWSFVHVDDAAEATARALRGPSGVYNVVDDDPAPMALWLTAFAEELRAPAPMRAPKLLAGLVAGRGAVRWLDALEGADNSRAKQALAWQPAHASWREGFRTL